MSINNDQRARSMPPRMPPRMGRLSGLPPMSRPLPPTSRSAKPALNLSQLGLSPKPEQTPFANFSKYV